MKKIITFICLAIFLTSFNSCISIHSISITDVKSPSGKEVNGSASGIGVLHISAPKGLAERATYELRDKGAVGNISTVLTMRDWGVIQFYKVTAIGTTGSK
ncbi:MAG: hypothetical protein ACK5ZX_00635 [Bacteroidota bacterium]